MIQIRTIQNLNLKILKLNDKSRQLIYREGRKIQILNIKKVKLSILLLLLTFLFISCSNSNEIEQEKVSEIDESTIDETEVDDKDIQKKETIDISELTDEEIKKNFPETQIYTSKIGRSSFVIKTKIDASTEIAKEIVQTLTEFNAINTDDGAMLTLPEDILFDFDSDELLPESKKAIQQLVQIIETTDDDVTIVGHTDSRGEDDYNQNLSERRAEAILQGLVGSGIKKERLIAEGKGASEPVAKNTNSDGSDNPESRQKNRRVEVTVHSFNQ